MKIAITVPSPGESVTEVVLAKWEKPNGSFVKKDEKIAEIESDKAALEVYAEKEGILHHLVEEGATVPVGATIAEIETDTQKQSSAQEPPTPSLQAAPDPQAPTNSQPPPPMPAAQKLIQEKQLEVSTLTPTGKEGRILKEDVLKALEKIPKPSQETPPLQETNSPPDARPVRRQKLSQLRRTIAKRLLYAKNQTAMLTTFNEVDMSAILQLRKQYKETFEKKHQIGLGFMSFFAKACSLALLEFPPVNAQWTDEELIFHDYVDLAIAVSTDRGLVVPVIPNAHTKTFAQLEKAIADLATRARNNQLSLSELEGGTFTITNGGVFGSLLSTPILNPPQTAILGMHKIQERPIALNGQVVIRPMMYVALSYDHRVIDGKEAVSFLVRVKELLEDPTRLLLHV
ncbi:MAG: 2-oxoglutarate dehydrogenase complex dihydrolipoyllysine-residue succinyltransferase [Bacteroidia bacterium]